MKGVRLKRDPGEGDPHGVNEMGVRSAEASGAVVERLEIMACTVPTDGPGGKESDGTLEWTDTTMVVVELEAGGRTGIGYTYGDVSTAVFIESKLADVVLGADPFEVSRTWQRMRTAIRNVGQPGVGAMAMSAVDTALWDVKARMLDVPLFRALDPCRDRVPIYGSGGFCNYPEPRLVEQLCGWVEQGISRVKLKISRHPEQDPARLRAVRAAIGDEPALMTDANGALSRKQALEWAHRLRDEWNATWMEEPVPSEDREGLRQIRAQGPPGLDVAAGEYGYVLRDFTDLLDAGCVDCLQVDVTRCGGITGLLQVGGLCAARHVDLSAHCAPTLSAHAFCAVPRVRHLEYFHDHVRVERLLFDGVLSPRGGCLVPDPAGPGLGIELRRPDVQAHLELHRERIR